MSHRKGSYMQLISDKMYNDLEESVYSEDSSIIEQNPKLYPMEIVKKQVKAKMTVQDLETIEKKIVENIDLAEIFQLEED